MIVIPASLRSDFIHMTGMTIHIALESTIHIAGIRTCQAVQAEQSANLCPVANFVHQDVENNPSGCGSQKIVY
jgi:hypothetical protein